MATPQKIPATLIPGDGIGPEVAEATLAVLEAVGAPFEWDEQKAGMAGVAHSAVIEMEAAILAAEGSRWVVTLVGTMGDHPPTDEAAWLAFAAGIAVSLAPGFVLDLMLVQQLPGRPKPVLVDKLNDGNQLFQLVFQGRPGQHDP